MGAVSATLQVLVSLGVVCALIWFLSRRMLGRTGSPRRRASRVQVLGKSAVAAKASVVVVEVEGRRMVLGVTEHGVSVLHDADAPEPEPEPEPSAPLRREWRPGSSHRLTKDSPLDTLIKGIFSR